MADAETLAAQLTTAADLVTARKETRTVDLTGADRDWLARLKSGINTWVYPTVTVDTSSDEFVIGSFVLAGGGEPSSRVVSIMADRGYTLAPSFATGEWELRATNPDKSVA